MVGQAGLLQGEAGIGAGDHLVEVEHVEGAVGDHPVPSPVLVVVGGEDVRPDLQLGGLVGPADVVDDVVALNVDVGVDLVGDLEGEGAQANGAVVGGGGQPVHVPAAGQRPARRAVPEADVVALGGVALDLLLVGEALLASEEHEVGDGSGRVGAAQQRGDDDAPGGAQGDGVGAHPAGRDHRLVNVLLVAFDGEVDGVAQEPIRGAGAADEVVGDVEPGEDLVEARQCEVGQDRPEQQGVDHEHRIEVPARADEQPGQPERGDGGDGEEDGVEDVVDAPGAGIDLRHLGRAVPVDGWRRRTGASHLG